MNLEATTIDLAPQEVNYRYSGIQGTVMEIRLTIEAAISTLAEGTTTMNEEMYIHELTLRLRSTTTPLYAAGAGKFISKLVERQIDSEDTSAFLLVEANAPRRDQLGKGIVSRNIAKILNIKADEEILVEFIDDGIANNCVVCVRLGTIHLEVSIANVLRSKNFLLVLTSLSGSDLVLGYKNINLQCCDLLYDHLEEFLFRDNIILHPSLSRDGATVGLKVATRNLALLRALLATYLDVASEYA